MKNFRKYFPKKVFIILLLGFTLISFGLGLTIVSNGGTFSFNRAAQLLGIDKWLTSPKMGGNYQTLVDSPTPGPTTTPYPNDTTPPEFLIWQYNTLPADVYITHDIAILADDYDDSHADGHMAAIKLSINGGTRISCPFNFGQIGDNNIQCSMGLDQNVYTLGANTVIFYAIDVNGNESSSVTFDVTYHDHVEEITNTPTPTPSGEPTPTTAPLHNDNFANAQVLVVDSSFRDDGMEIASVESGEPTNLLLDKFTTTRTLWYKWTTDNTDPMTLKICNAQYDYGTFYQAYQDFVIGVYTGSAVDALTLVAENDIGDHCAANVSFTPENGTTYYFQISQRNSDVMYGWFDVLLTADLLVTPAPANDNFANATVITIDNMDNFGEYLPYGPGNLHNATFEAVEPDAATYALHPHSVWLKWTNDGTERTVWFDTCGVDDVGQADHRNNVDSVIDVFTGESVDALTNVSNNDDWGTDNSDALWQCDQVSYTSFTTFLAEPDTTYYFRIIEISDINDVIHTTIRTKPIHAPALPVEDVPNTHLWCANNSGIARTIPYGAAEEIVNGNPTYSWSDCLAWCTANMSEEAAVCQMNADGARSCWLQRTPGGSMENCQWAPPTFGNEWPKGTYFGQTDGYTLTIADSSLRATLESSLDIDVSINKQRGQKSIYVVDVNAENVVADVDVQFNYDRTWTDISAGSDITSARSFVHNLMNEDGVVTSSYVLYVPIPINTESSSVLICPGADSIVAINYNCPNAEIKNYGDLGVSKVTVDSKQYWRVEGVTGTGGQSLLSSFDSRDLMTRLQVSTPSNHDIYFGSAYGLQTSGENIVLKFNGDWDMSTLTVADLIFTSGVTTLSLAENNPDVDVWGVVTDNVTNTITLTTPLSGTGYIAANDILRLQILNNKIVNPTNSSPYMIEIDIHNDAHGGPEYGQVTVPIVDSDQVNITGYVNAYMEFDIDTGTGETPTYLPGQDGDVVDCAYNECLNHSSGSSADNYTVDLGNLTIGAINKSGDDRLHTDGSGVINSIYFDLTTNAASGVVVTYQSLYGELRGPGHNTNAGLDYDIPTTDGNTDITSHVRGYGIQLATAPVYKTVGTGTQTVDCGDTSVTYCIMGVIVDGDNTQLPSAIYTTSGPIELGRGKIDVAAAIDGTVVPGDYEDFITFVATSTF